MACKACKRDLERDNARQSARLERVNEWRESRGKARINSWSIHLGMRYRVSEDNAEVCRRMHTTAPQWWEREPGYVAEEIKRALRRTKVDAGLSAKRNRDGSYKAIDYTLPLPSLSASGKRLASGAREVEEWVRERRYALGLSCEPETRTYTNDNAA